MKLNYLIKGLSTLGRWTATALVCMLAIAFVWQGAFFSNTTAMANPTVLIADADIGSKVQGKANEDAGRAKNFIDDTADSVKRTAKKNASRVEEATDGSGNFIERKARRDAARIQKRANEDAATTKSAVDKTKNTVERTVDNIKDAFRG